MARKYSPSASKDVEREMHKFKRGQLKSGKSGKGGTVKSRKQAIAIGLSEARKKGKKVPKKKAVKRGITSRRDGHRHQRRHAQWRSDAEERGASRGKSAASRKTR